MNSFVLTYTMVFETSYDGKNKAFLQISIDEDDMEAMRFHWIKHCEILETGVLQFISLLLDTIKHDLGRKKCGVHKQSKRTSDEAGFKLNKFHSNVSVLEGKEDQEKIDICQGKTFPKQQLNKGDMKTTILGISGNKQDNKLEVKFIQCQTSNQERSIEIPSINLRPDWTEIINLSMWKDDLQRY